MMKRFVIILLLSLSAGFAAWGQSLRVTDLQATLVDGRHVLLTWTRYPGMTMALYRLEPASPNEVFVDNITWAMLPSFVDGGFLHQYCSDTVRYYFRDPQTNEICSNICSVLVYDPVPTTPCEPGVATVDEDSQQIVLSWDPSPDPDIMGYYICKGNPCLDYDTAWGRESNSYVCQDLSSLNASVFRVLAFDSCMNPSPLTDPFGNMVLSLAAQDCSSRLSLSWNAYEGMVGGVDAYRLQARYDDAGQWLDIQTLTTTTAQVDVPGNVASARFRVLAQNDHYEAASNIVSYHFSTADSAQYLHISHASVQPDGRSVQLGFYVDPDFQSPGYRLYRAEGNGSFHLIANLPYQAQQRFCYLDANVIADHQVVNYRLSSFDGCGRNEKFSNTVSTMPIEIADQGPSVKLQWHPYQGWVSLEGYSVWRRAQSQSHWDLLADVGLANEYVDDIAHQPSLTEALYYRVMAQESAGTGFNLADTAYSAEVGLKRDATIYFPNAFTPSLPDNNTFGPVYTFMDVDDYELYIYDRNGELLFSTHNPAERWDGTSRGRLVPQGTYVYTAKCHTLKHRLRQFTGTVLLIR